MVQSFRVYLSLKETSAKQHNTHLKSLSKQMRRKLSLRRQKMR